VVLMVGRRRSGVDRASSERVKKRVAGFKRGLFLETKKALRKHGQRWFALMARQFRAPYTPYGQPNNNRTLHNRTNALRGSLRRRVVGTQLNNLGLKLTSSSIYAPMQEFGGRIRPRRAKMLAIPVGDALFPAGGRRYSSPQQFRNDPDVRFKKTDDGKLYLVRDVRGGGPTGLRATGREYLFALRKEVDIPGPMSRKRKMPSRLGFRENAIGQRPRRRLMIGLAKGVRNAIKAQVAG